MPANATQTTPAPMLYLKCVSSTKSVGQKAQLERLNMPIKTQSPQLSAHIAPKPSLKPSRVGNKAQRSKARRIGHQISLTGTVLAALLLGTATQSSCLNANFSTAPSSRELAIQGELFALAKLEDSRTTDPNLFTPYVSNENDVIRARTALAMGRIQEPSYAGHLRTLMGDDEKEVRAAAIFALGQLPDTPIEGDLVARAAIERDSELRALIIEALGKIGAEDSVSTLLNAARDSNSEVQVRAIQAIGIQGYRERWPEGIPQRLANALIEAMADNNPQLRIAATYSVIRAPMPEVSKAQIMDSLLQHLGDDVAAVRANAVRALAKVSDGISPQQIVPLIRDEDWQVRVNAVAALGKLGGTKTAYLLKPALEDQHLLVQEQAIQALGAVGDSAAVEWILPFLASDHLGLKVSALETIAALDGDNQLETLVQYASDSDAIVRSGAVGAISQIEGIQVANKLVELASKEQDPRVMVSLAIALSTRNDEVSIEASLLDFLRRGDGAAVSVSAEVLAEIKSETALPHLIEAYKRQHPGRDYEAQVYIINSLKTIGGPEALLAPLLNQALEDADQRVALAGAEALETLFGTVVEVVTAPPRFPTGSSEYFNIGERTRTFINTNKGQIVIELYPEKAPLTVHNFTRLARNGYYDGLVWHRVVPNFVAQTGSPRGDGWGGPGHSIRCEINDISYDRGVMGMALSGKDTGGSQFFITHSPQPHLDGGYTVFARVVEGMEVVDTLVRGDHIVNIRFGDEPEKLDPGRPVGL